jgi:hypothetical protein
MVVTMRTTVFYAMLWHLVTVWMVYLMTHCQLCRLYSAGYTNENQGTQREPCPIATLFTTNPTQTDLVSNTGLQLEKPVSSRLSHGNRYCFGTCCLHLLYLQKGSSKASVPVLWTTHHIPQDSSLQKYSIHKKPNIWLYTQKLPHGLTSLSLLPVGVEETTIWKLRTYKYGSLWKTRAREGRNT